MKLKHSLAGLALLLATTAATPTRSQEPPRVAKGLVLAEPYAMELMSFAHIQVVVDNDTLDFYAGPTGLARYEIPLPQADGTLVSLPVYVQPGFANQDLHLEDVVGEENALLPGDYFEPYKSVLEVRPGANELQYLKKVSAPLQKLRAFDYFAQADKKEE